MAVPARPTSGVPIETAWGQVAHDTAVAMDIQSGIANATTGAAGAVSAVVTVTFPRPFASAPIVNVSPVNAGGIITAVLASAPTATSVGLACKRTDAGGAAGIPLHWIAYGPRA